MKSVRSFNQNQESPRRPYRHVALADLLILSIMGDTATRQVVEHELDLRTFHRLAEELSERYFEGLEMPTGGRFARKGELDASSPLESQVKSELEKE